MTNYILPPNDVVAKEIPGFPGYWATDDGRIWSGKTGRFRIPAVRNKRTGHLALAMRKRRAGVPPLTKFVHQMVAAAFHGPKPVGFVTRHLDGNPKNNRPENLAYGTYKDNLDDDVRLGLCEPGAGNQTTTITGAQARLLVELSAAGLSNIEAALAAGVNRYTGRSVIQGVSWPHLRRCPFQPPKRLLDLWKTV